MAPPGKQVRGRRRFVARGFGDQQGVRRQPLDALQPSDSAPDQVLAIGRIEEHQIRRIPGQKPESVDRQNTRALLCAQCADVRAQSGVRAFVKVAGHNGLTRAYNAAVQAVADFRSRHLEYAASYIHSQGRKSAGNDTEIGTGGTPFMKYLKKHRDETRANLIDA